MPIPDVYTKNLPLSKNTRKKIEAVKVFAKETAGELAALKAKYAARKAKYAARKAKYAALKAELDEQKRKNKELKKSKKYYKNMVLYKNRDGTVSITDTEEYQDLSNFEDVLGAGQGNQEMTGEGGRADSPASVITELIDDQVDQEMAGEGGRADSPASVITEVIDDQVDQEMAGEGGRIDWPAPVQRSFFDRPALIKTDEPGEVMVVPGEGGHAGNADDTTEDEEEPEVPCGTIKTDYTLDDMNSGAGTPEDEN